MRFTHKEKSKIFFGVLMCVLIFILVLPTKTLAKEGAIPFESADVVTRRAIQIAAGTSFCIALFFYGLYARKR